MTRRLPFTCRTKGRAALAAAILAAVLAAQPCCASAKDKNDNRTPGPSPPAATGIARLPAPGSARAAAPDLPPPRPATAEQPESRAHNRLRASSSAGNDRLSRKERKTLRKKLRRAARKLRRAHNCEDEEDESGSVFEAAVYSISLGLCGIAPLAAGETGAAVVFLGFLGGFFLFIGILLFFAGIASLAAPRQVADSGG